MLQVDSEDARAVVGRFETVGVAVLRGELDEPFFDRLGVTLDALAEQSGEFSALVVRASEVPGAMGSALRDKAKRTLSRHEKKLCGFAYVLGGGGLKAKLVRGAMNAVLKTMPFPAKIFPDARAAVGWLARLPGQPPEVRDGERELLRAVEGQL